MRGFISVLCLVAAALARPEAGGYNYNGLQSAAPQNVHQLPPHVHQQLPVEHSFANFAAPPTTFQAPSAAPTEETADHDLQQLNNAVTPIEDVAKSSHEDSYNMAYQQSMNSHDNGGYAYTPETTIHKHIYVHVPPKEFEDEDVITTRVYHQAAPKQKHYKIVFIKAPAAPSIRPPVVPPPPQNEEKTLIYVLHKRPELEQDIIIPTAAPTKPSKPEVFFIKYKTKKEEAPVYGPPPQLDMQPRNIEAPTTEYGAPTVDSFLPETHISSDAPLTTGQPADQAEPATQAQPQQQPFTPSDVYSAPTMAGLVAPEEVVPQPTLAAPSNQYLAPEATQTMPPIIVEDNNVPSNKYGPPNRFFIKKKK